jgi:hypothetical protein
MKIQCIKHASGFDALDFFHAPIDKLKMKYSFAMAQSLNAFKACYYLG